jgi:Protein of unknown function (DUF4232)
MRGLLVSSIVLLALAPWAPQVQANPLARCPSGTVKPTLITNGAGGTIVVSVSLRNTSGHSCVARGRVVLAIRDAQTRRLLDVVGNPHRKAIDRSLRPGKTLTFALQWLNYCGPGRPVVLEATWGSKRAAERAGYPGARCDSSSAPSRLRPFRLGR